MSQPSQSQSDAVRVVTLADYQKEALRTAANGTLAVWALGLCGESGEFADLVKKHLGHGHPLDGDKALKELGDVLWYVAATANALGSTLEDVAALNIAKLRARYPDGFNTERSINRGPEAA